MDVVFAIHKVSRDYIASLYAILWQYLSHVLVVLTVFNPFFRPGGQHLIHLTWPNWPNLSHNTFTMFV